MGVANILLVEDNEGDILLARQMLNESGINHILNVLKDGEAAIRFLSTTKESLGAKFPDLILLDVNLPKKNGFEVLRYIKSSAKTRHLPVIMLTTSSHINDRELALKTHADLYFTKPLEVGTFKNAVMELIPGFQSFLNKVALKHQEV
jgi:CheY-like chemotaxis protein